MDGCERKHNSHGLCGMHGLRLVRHGDVNNLGRLIRSDGSCSVEGCDRVHCSGGLCGMHHQRMRRSGSTEIPETLTCDRCGVDFARPFKGNPQAVRFCSHECRYETQLADARANAAERYAYLKGWRERNPGLLKASLLRRDAAKRSAECRTVTGRDLARLVRHHGGLCAYCRSAPHEHFDHVVPLSRGGRHAIGNLLPACAACNLAKGARLLSEWRLMARVPRRFRHTAA